MAFEARYDHDCSRCVFLATEGSDSDWYVCKGRSLYDDTIIQRLSDEGGDYITHSVYYMDTKIKEHERAMFPPLVFELIDLCRATGLLKPATV